MSVAEEPPSLAELGRRVFLVLLRAVGPEHNSSPLPFSENSIPATKAKGRKHAEKLAAGEQLVSEASGMLRPSAVLDVCALYGRSNPGLVAGLLRSLAALEGGKLGVTLVKGLGAAGTVAARALGDVHAKVKKGVFEREGGEVGGCLYNRNVTITVK